MKHAFSSILIHGHRNIGDILHNTAVLKPLKKAFPQARIAILTSPVGKSLLQGNPYLSEIFDFEKAKGIQGYLRRLSLIRFLRQKRFDLIINLKSGSYFPYLLGVKTIWGIRSEDKTLHSKRNKHAIDIYLNALGHHGIRISKEDLDMKIQTTPSEQETIKEILSKNEHTFKKPLIVIVPFSNWHAKEWPPERFGKLSEKLATQHNAHIVFVGGEKDQKKMEKLAFSHPHYTDLVGKLSLRECATLYEKTTLVIGVDSGPFHLATNMRVPSLALFGATTHQHTYPYFEPNNYVTCETNLGCNPCYPGNRLMVCGVYNRPTPCMEALSFEQVYEKARSLLLAREKQEISKKP